MRRIFFVFYSLNSSISSMVLKSTRFPMPFGFVRKKFMYKKQIIEVDDLVHY